MSFFSFHCPGEFSDLVEAGLEFVGLILDILPQLLQNRLGRCVYIAPEATILVAARAVPLSVSGLADRLSETIDRADMLSHILRYRRYLILRKRAPTELDRKDHLDPVGVLHEEGDIFHPLVYHSEH